MPPLLLLANQQIHLESCFRALVMAREHLCVSRLWGFSNDPLAFFESFLVEVGMFVCFGKSMFGPGMSFWDRWDRWIGTCRTVVMQTLEDNPANCGSRKSAASARYRNPRSYYVAQAFQLAYQFPVRQPFVTEMRPFPKVSVSLFCLLTIGFIFTDV